MILPVAKSIYICDWYVASDQGKIDLKGLLNTVHAEHGFPHVHDRLCLFAQLIGDLGKVPFFFDIRAAATGELVHTSGTRHLTFPSRDVIVQVAVTVAGLRFKSSGSYIIDLMCDNTWVADTSLLVR